MDRKLSEHTSANLDNTIQEHIEREANKMWQIVPGQPRDFVSMSNQGMQNYKAEARTLPHHRIRLVVKQ